MAIFFQGCPHICEGCHNPESWPYGDGNIVTVDYLLGLIDANPLLQGITFTGGEPLIRAGALLPLAAGIAERGLDIAIYTGYTFDEILESGGSDVTALLGYASTLIDGRFVLAQKSLTLRFRGSANQRILDARESLRQGKAVATSDERWSYTASIM
jgi:anaerobic ribonucleoside-triphosphate reductase activating protein